jgi:hypothetical protein
VAVVVMDHDTLIIVIFTHIVPSYL